MHNSLKAPDIKTTGLPVKHPSSDNSSSSNDNDSDFGGCPVIEETPMDDPLFLMFRPLHYFQVFLAFASFTGFLTKDTQTIKPKFFGKPGFPLRAGRILKSLPAWFPTKGRPIFVHSQGQSLCFLLYFTVF
jgi:hypothetical protein